MVNESSLHEFYQNNKKTIIMILCLFLFLVLFFLLSLLFSNQKKEGTKNKIEKEKNYVYTKGKKQIETSGIYSYYPYLNLEGEDARTVNEEFLSLYEEEKNDMLRQVTYDYDVSKDYLSIVLFQNEIDKNTLKINTTITTYVFSISSKTRYENNTLLSLFHKTEEDIKKGREEKLLNIYEKAVDQKKLYKNVCDYTCFLRTIGVKEEVGNVSYYVKKNKLYFFAPFDVFALSSDDEEAIKDNFLFQVK